MEALIKGHDVHVGDNLRDLIAKKTARLERYLPEWAMVDAKIDLREIHSRGSGPIKIVEMTIATRGAILRSEAKAPDFAAALDEAVERMTRRIVRYRSRWRDHRSRGERILPALPDEAAGLVADLGDEQENDQPRTIVRTKRFAVKPMDVDEAVEQMELLGHDFFVFFNREEEQTNVLYRRGEGGYGLIQPEFS